MYLGYEELAKRMATPEELEKTEEYLASKLAKFLRPGDRLLLCYPFQKSYSIGQLFEKAARRIGVVPVVWQGDMRWKALLKLAFDSRARAIAGTPLVILGLTKLAQYTRTPLNFRYVLTSGYPCLDWMIHGIRRGLDCGTWGCMGIGFGPVVAGFSCDKSLGVHLRDDCFDALVVDDAGEPVPDGENGKLLLRLRGQQELMFNLGDQCRLETAPCPCGCNSPRLMDLNLGEGADMPILDLAERLLSWGSVLDCRITRQECGLELELVVFPGEKLPKLPTVARQTIRPWNPEKDSPFLQVSGWNVPDSG